MSALSELDAASRRTLTLCGLKQLVMLTAAAAFALANPPSLLRFATLVELYTFIGGIAAVTCAIIRRQKPEPHVINHWDESLAFGAVCLMAHIGSARCTDRTCAQRSSDRRCTSSASST